MNLSISEFIYLSIYLSSMHVSICLYVCIDVCTYVRTCMYVCMYIYIYNMFSILICNQIRRSLAPPHWRKTETETQPAEFAKKNGPLYPQSHGFSFKAFLRKIIFEWNSLTMPAKYIIRPRQRCRGVIA